MRNVSLKSWHLEPTNRCMRWLQHTRMVRHFKYDVILNEHFMFSISPHFTLMTVSPAYGRDIEEDIITDTSGHFKKMLVVLLQVSSQRC